jgi:hypothetical protein
MFATFSELAQSFRLTMKPIEQPFSHKVQQLSDSVGTMETDDVTNESSTSSGLGASLDMDVHGFSRTSHIRTNQRGQHHYHRFGDSQDGLGESFMLEDSFAMGESFSCFEESGTVHDGPRRFIRERPDIATILAIEEDDEDDGKGFEKERAPVNTIHELERETKKMTLKPHKSKISVKG